MRRAAVNIIILIVAVTLLGACHRESRVEWLEPLTDDYPDSALTILRQLSQEKLSARDRAICNLLLTRAIDKASADYQTDDSLARAALDYFSRHDDPHFEMLSHYYLGQIAFTNKDYTEAILSLQQCVDLADQLGDHLNLALAYRTLSDLYRETYFGSDAIQAAKLALSEFEKSGDKGTKYIDWAYNDIADAYLAGGEYDSCYIFSKKALQLARLKDNIFLERNALSTLAVAYTQQQMADSAMSAMNCILNKFSLEELTNVEIRTLAIAKAYLGNSEESKFYADILSNRGIDFKYAYLNSYIAGDYKEAYLGLREAVVLYNDQFHGIQRSPIANSIKYYLEEKVKAEKFEHKANKFKLLAIIISLILIFTTIFFLYYQKIKKTRFDMQLKLDELPRLYELVSHKDDIICNLQEENRQLQDLSNKTNHPAYRMHAIRNTVFNEFKELEKILSDIQKLKKDRDHHSAIEKDVLQLVDKLKFNESTLILLEKEIDDKFDGLMSSFKEDFPKFKDIYYFVFAYSIAGFSPQSIALFIGKDVTKVYDIKKRIKKLIELHHHKNKYIPFIA